MDSLCRLRIPTFQVALIAVALTTGCAHTSAPEEFEGPGEGTLLLLTPHWDQVCRDDRSPQLFREVGEILDDSGDDHDLVARIAAMLPKRAPDDLPSFVDVAVTWERSGAVRSVHLSDHNTDPELSGEVVLLVAERVREVPSLLHPVFVRVRATGAPDARLDLLPGLRCLPHVQHGDDEPPRFLGNARVLGGGYLLPSQAEVGLRVRLSVSPSGDLLEVEPVQGNAALLDRVLESLEDTTFDPALINGEPIRGELDLVFVFPPDPT